MDPKIDTQQLFSQAMNQTPKSAPGRDPEKLKGAAQQFEAVFIQQMFKAMRESVPEGGLFEKDNADDIYAQMQDAEAAKIMAQQGGIGLADLMVRQLLDEE